MNYIDIQIRVIQDQFFVDLAFLNQFCIFLQFRYIEIELGPYGHHIVLLLDGVSNAIAKLLPIQYDATIGEN